MTDIAIVGGGPAGATLALCLARLGHAVEVYERGAFTRAGDGESLHPGIWPLFETLRISDAGALRVHRSLVRWSDDAVVEQRHPLPQLAVMRPVFDAQLLDMARNAGAVIEQPASFEGDARIVVDASGRSSWSRTKRTRTSERTIAMRGTFRGAGLPRQARVEAVEDGWIWGSPMPDGGFAVIACVDGETPHPAYGHLLPASGEKDLVESPSPRFAGRGWREAPGEGCFFAMLRASELFRDLRGEVTVRCHDATTYAAEVVCDETLIRVGDASHSLDPLSSSGIRSAMQSALHASIVINTILRKPERTALALQFYRDTQRAAVEQHIAWTRSFYAESRFRDAPFWRKRSDSGAAGSRPADMNRRAESPPLQKDVTLADGIAIEDVPCIVGDFIEPRRGVTGTTRPFVWICGAEAAALLAPLEQRPMRGEDLLRSWHVRVPRGRELAIFDELVRHGVLTGI